MKPTLVILAGGMGSRYGGLKQLDGVGPNGETIIDYSIFDSIRAGFKKIVFVVRETTVDDFKVQISDRLAARVDAGGVNASADAGAASAASARGPVEVEFVYQSVEPSLPGVGVVARRKPWGTGHAVLVTQDVVTDPFAVINADDYYGLSAFKLMHECLTQRVSPVHYAMVGFELGNTLSTNGSVSRAICEVDDSQRLLSIVERTRIIAKENRIVDQSASPPVALSQHDQVSMNFWGFHPSFFPALEKSFNAFAVANKANPEAEFYIPLVVDELIQNGTAAVEVLESREQWHGLTYAEDRAGIQQALAKMTDEGLYPSPLWKA